MNKNIAKADYLSTDYTDTERELFLMDEADPLRIEIDEGLESALEEMQNLRNQLSTEECASLIELSKNTVIETITGQFGLASMFIAAKDGGSVTTVHNFEQGIVANEADAAKHSEFVSNHDGNRKWADVRADYNEPLANMRKERFQKNAVIIDEYTGKELPKDGRAHLDHIVAVKEVESNAAANLAMDKNKRVEAATGDHNLAFTEASANRSKSDLPMKEWIDKTQKGQKEANAQRFNIDRDRAMDKDKRARKFVRNEINTATARKYTKELLSTGGKDAAKMAAYAVLGIVMRDVVQTVFVEIHITLEKRGTESLSEVFDRFKKGLLAGIENIKNKWKENLLEVGLQSGTAFISNLAVFAINLFATTLKKIVSMIRAGIVSLAQAVKILAHPPANMPKEEVRYQALKILTAGIIGAASLGLSAGIEKFLQAIPGLQPLMMFPIPSFGSEQRTVSDVIAVILSALVGGLITTVVLYFMDTLRSDNKSAKMQITLVNQSGIAVQYGLAKTWLCLHDAYVSLNNAAVEFVYYVDYADTIITESGKKADAAIERLKLEHERVKGLENR